MQTHIDTTTQLDPVRADADARRFVHAQRPTRSTARRALSTGLATVLLILGTAVGAGATVTDTGAHCSGYEPGMPDGCWGSTRVLDTVIDMTLVPDNVR